VAFLSVVSVNLLAQPILGTNGYVEYIAGDLPIVISVPHGGDLQPADIPDRTCNDPVYATDLYTIELAKQIDSAFFELTGCYPHLIISHLHRRKLDCNRTLLPAACNDPQAVIAWNEFHGFITQAQTSVLMQFGEGFYLDLHGHGNIEQRVELGYMLYEEELELSDEILNTSTYVNYSSLYDLVMNNISGSTHAELLRGTIALGTLLGDAGYPSVPSAQDPAPGIGNNYFSGGYNTNTHTSANPANYFSGVQVECNYHGVRDNFANRKSFSLVFSVAISEFMLTHCEIGLGTCSFLDLATTNALSEVRAYPMPLSLSDGALKIQGMERGSFVLYDLLGNRIQAGDFNHNTIHLINLSEGMYQLQIEGSQGRKRLPVLLSK
jgi:N-formylglutamate amidohydrolase